MRVGKSPHEIDDLFKAAIDQQNMPASEPNVGFPGSELPAAAPDAPYGSADGDAAQLLDSAEPQVPESGYNDEAVSTGPKPQSKSARNGTPQKALRRRTPAIDASAQKGPAATFGQATAERYMSVRQVAARYGVGLSTIWRWAADDDNFPRPFQLSSGITRWLESELRSFEALRRTRK